MTTPYLALDVAEDEGFRARAYPDPLSPLGKACSAAHLDMSDYRRVIGWEQLSGRPWTIGYGHTGAEVHEGLEWTREHALEVLKSDLAQACRRLDDGAPWWRKLSPLRQDVLANMCFNLGWDDPRTPAHEGLSGFHDTLSTMQAGAYTSAALHMLDSKWAHQVGQRATRLARQMRTGLRARDA